VRKFLLGGIVLASAALIQSGGASAQVRMDPSVSRIAQDTTLVGFRHGGGGHFHGGGRGFRGHGGRYYGGHRGGYGVGAGLAGLAVGAVIGGAIASSQSGYYAHPAYNGGDPTSYCASKFKSYDPSSGTYLGYDGLRHPCP
jgi:hypothetical protein